MGTSVCLQSNVPSLPEYYNPCFSTNLSQWLKWFIGWRKLNFSSQKIGTFCREIGIDNGLLPGEGREGTVEYTWHWYPKFYNHGFLFVGYFNWLVIDWFHISSVQTFKPMILIYRCGDCVYYHWNIHNIIVNCLLYI